MKLRKLRKITQKKFYKSRVFLWRVEDLADKIAAAFEPMSKLLQTTLRKKLEEQKENLSSQSPFSFYI